MKTIFILFTIYVVASAYHWNEKGTAVQIQGELPLYQQRDNIPRKHHHQHHYYKQTDEDSNEYLRDDSNRYSDSVAYENDDDSDYMTDEDSDDVDWTFEKRQRKPHYDGWVDWRRPYMNRDANEDSDSSSYENSDSGSYENSDDDGSDKNSDEVYWRHVKGQRKPHYDRRIDDSRRFYMSRYANEDSDSSSYENSDNGSYENSDDDESDENSDEVYWRRPSKPRYYGRGGLRRPYVYWKLRARQNKDEDSDNDSNRNSDNASHEDDDEGDDPYTPKVGARFCGTH